MAITILLLSSVDIYTFYGFIVRFTPRADCGDESGLDLLINHVITNMQLNLFICSFLADYDLLVGVCVILSIIVLPEFLNMMRFFFLRMIETKLPDRAVNMYMKAATIYEVSVSLYCTCYRICLAYM